MPELKIRRGHQFGSELQQSATFDVRLDDLNSLPRDLQLPIIGLRVREILIQRRQSVALGLKELPDQIFSEIEVVARNRK